jgi:hypothetical protein
MGVPTCWQHTRREYGVRQRQSTIPGAGKGLFATEDFSEDEWIVPYEGERITTRCLNQRYPGNTTATYATSQNRGAIDAACRRGIASVANGLFTNTGRPRTQNAHNARIEERGANRDLWLRANHDISANEEIFVYYGKDYRLEDDHTTKRNRKPDTRPC